MCSLPSRSLLSHPMPPFSTPLPCHKVAPQIHLRGLGCSVCFPACPEHSPARNVFLCVFNLKQANKNGLQLLFSWVCHRHSPLLWVPLHPLLPVSWCRDKQQEEPHLEIAYNDNNMSVKIYLLTSI